MRIAQVSPLFESVPPRAYGGSERVVSYLTEELVNQGHEVTLYASGDSATRAQLVPCCSEALRLGGDHADFLPVYTLMLDQVFADAPSFDIVHFHIGYLHFPLTRRAGIPTVTTLHGRLDMANLFRVYRRFREMPVVSISNAQREPLSWLNYQATVYNGVPAELFDFQDGIGDYLVFVGRISPEKRADRAIEIAKRVGMEVKIAAKVDPVDGTYFKEVIKPLLNHPLVDYLGEISDAEKNELLGGAYALLLPIDWPEPFGLVMIEAMACGTPVVAYRNGSVPEVLDDGVTGFIVNNIDQAVTAVERIAALPRKRCREVFEKRFSAARMTRDYLAVYERLVEHYSEVRAVG